MTAKIPTHIITGFLGVGKTTALNHLLTQKPADETWAIIVNEFGKVGVDQVAFPSNEGVQIKEIAGGCVCCALGPALTINLATLIRRVKPHRLIIEPTGLGHPTGLIDIIQGVSFAEVLSLQSVICLLDPRSLDNPDYLQHPTFADQLNLADIIVINKTDLASPAQVKTAQERTQAMFPPKQQVISTVKGEIPFAVLAADHDSRLQAEYPDTHQHQSSPAAPQPLLITQPGHPVRLTGHSEDAHSCGWVFHADDVFDYARLSACLNSITDIWRMKGVFNLGPERLFYNRVDTETHSYPIAWRRDSRLEIIARTAHDWTEIENRLKSCLCVKTP